MLFSVRINCRSDGAKESSASAATREAVWRGSKTLNVPVKAEPQTLAAMRVLALACEGALHLTTGTHSETVAFFSLLLCEVAKGSTARVGAHSGSSL